MMGRTFGIFAHALLIGGVGAIMLGILVSQSIPTGMNQSPAGQDWRARYAGASRASLDDTSYAYVESGPQDTMPDPRSDSRMAYLGGGYADPYADPDRGYGEPGGNYPDDEAYGADIPLNPQLAAMSDPGADSDPVPDTAMRDGRGSVSGAAVAAQQVASAVLTAQARPAASPEAHVASARDASPQGGRDTKRPLASAPGASARHGAVRIAAETPVPAHLVSAAAEPSSPPQAASDVASADDSKAAVQVVSARNDTL